jgi:hypothetical protein
MPWLDLMTEDKREFWMVFFKRGKDMLRINWIDDQRMYGVEFVDHDLAPRADIIHPKFNRVSSCLSDAMACKPGIESHFLSCPTPRQGGL